jgi:multiple sugar transport system ATP-binding protein
MTVFDNMAFGLKLRHTAKSEIKARVDEAARILDIVSLLDRKPKALSGGQRQRVAMGRAIVRNPKVFLFDEPLSNLDAKLRVQMRTEIKKVHQAVRTTTVYVTHDQVEAMTLADRVVVMNGGMIEQVGPPQELYHHPKTRFVAGFIGSPGMNFFPVQVGLDDVSFENGQVLPIPPARRSRYASRRNATMLLGIRPEHLTEAPRPGSAAITVLVDVVEPMGMETLVHFRLPATADGLCGHGAGAGLTPLYTARVTPETPAVIGRPLALYADMNHMHLIEPESGRVV